MERVAIAHRKTATISKKKLPSLLYVAIMAKTERVKRAIKKQ